MKRFPREFKYQGLTIRKTSFNWRIVEWDQIVESYQEAKDLIDRSKVDERRRKANALLNTDVEEFLSSGGE